MNLEVCDVKGDGNCYYRCIWNIVKHSYRLKSALGLEDCTTEHNAIAQLRKCVAMHMKCSNVANEHLKNIWEMSQEVEDIEEEYPIASVIKTCARFDYNAICLASHMICTTNMMASAFEHSIIQDLLTTVQFVIVSASTHQKRSITQWTKCIRKQLEYSTKKYVAILVNVNNIHYKYLKINGVTVATKDCISQLSRGRQ